MRPTTLYRFFDPAGVLLYVGISHRAVMRWGDHGRVRPWWPEVASITVEHFADRKAARAAEVKAIQTESPRHNMDDSYRENFKRKSSGKASLYTLTRSHCEHGHSLEDAYLQRRADGSVRARRCRVCHRIYMREWKKRHPNQTGANANRPTTRAGRIARTEARRLSMSTLKLEVA